MIRKHLEVALKEKGRELWASGQAGDAADRWSGFLLDGLGSPISLRYSLPYSIDVANGKPRPVNHDPTNRSFLDVRCGMKEVYISASVPIYAYESPCFTWYPSLERCVLCLHLADDPLVHYGIQVRLPLFRSSIDDGVVCKVKQWMQHCKTTHVECRALEAHAKIYPTRLLDLRGVESKGSSRIIDVPPGFQSEYVALSYCWGSKHEPWTNYVKTCQQTPERTVQLDRMPQTLQDVITCCLRLGYWYVWVDCLCILQGNKADWLAESARMSDIYANAALAITASDSKDCRDGFLTDRSLMQRYGAVLKVPIDDEGNAGYVRLCFPDTDFPSLVGDGPVAQRGWCLQERQLCSRLLHLCQGEVFFECIRCRRFEGESAPGEEFDVKDEFHAFHMPREAHDTGRGKPSPDVQNVFSSYSIMQDYTRRGLTMPDDKLVAVAALARRAQQVLGGDYLAGLWRKQIQIGLLWMIDEESSAFRAPIYRAPSWSWASMDGPVSWSLIDGWVQSEDGFVEPEIEVVESSIQLAGEDPFGPVQRVEIVVKGRLKHIPASQLLPNKVLTYPAWMSGRSAHIGCYLEDEKKVIESEQITCLKIASRPFGPGPSLPPTNEVIVLKKVNHSGHQDMDTYRRTGFGQMLVTDYFDDCVMGAMRLI